MIKLYERIQDKLFYKECWYTGSTAVVHRGVVGNEGMCEEYPCDDFERFACDFKKKYQRQGYAPVSDSEWVIMAIHLKARDLESVQGLRERITKELNERLGWLGLGHVDGYDVDAQRSRMGDFHFRIFCVVADEEIARRELIQFMDHIGVTSYTVDKM